MSSIAEYVAIPLFLVADVCISNGGAQWKSRCLAWQIDCFSCFSRSCRENGSIIIEYFAGWRLSQSPPPSRVRNMMKRHLTAEADNRVGTTEVITE